MARADHNIALGGHLNDVTLLHNTHRKLEAIPKVVEMGIMDGTCSRSTSKNLKKNENWTDEQQKAVILVVDDGDPI